MAARAGRVRANPPKAKARTRTSTRAMTETRTRNATTGTMVSGKRNSRDTVKVAQWSDVDSEDVDMDSYSWCFAALNNPKGRAGTLLVDSGADDHILSSRFCQRTAVEKDSDSERRARQPIISSRHSTRQSECGHTKTASKH